jgi:transposase
MRAALNQLAVEAPDWLAEVSTPEWFARYSHRAEQSRLPKQLKQRQALAVQVGRDGCELLGLLEQEQPDLLKLERLEMLKRVWQQHYTRAEDGKVRWRTAGELTKTAAAIESPYDPQARYNRKETLHWTGYKVHLSETCDEGLPHLITNVQTTEANRQDVACTGEIQAALSLKRLAPSRHLVDAGYVDADLIVESRARYGIELFGPTRLNPSWQARERGFDVTRFEIDWDRQQVGCPAGKRSVYWYEHEPKERYRRSIVKVRFDRRDCLTCEHRAKCVRSRNGAPRQLALPAKALHEALAKTRKLFFSDEGEREYQKRAGIEGTLSQGVRRGGLRRCRYRGLAKTHLQEVATAAAINILRTVNFLEQKPIAKTRVSRFARLAH